MAVYEYECTIHGVFEHTQSMKDPLLSKCPTCEKEGIESDAPKRLISLSAFHLAGGGWAKDRYS